MRILRPPRSTSSLLMLPAIVLLAIACLLIVPALVLDRLNVVRAAEVVATNDWTWLGENDTVAAGVHIRMDLETGQKWVKLVSEEDDKDNPDEASASASGRQRQASSSSSSAVVVTVDGESTTTTTGDRQAADDKSAASTSEYDFDMMHRTLDQLPDEEKVRIGLPEAPNKTTMTAAERADFEETMSRIWQRRQEELQKFQDEFVADLPQVLRDRIERLRQYVNDPVQELAGMDLATASANINKEDEHGPVVTHIVSVLADLEYHLSDIDMTRDFYTLGGWPYLVAMLKDDTHRARSCNASATTIGVEESSSSSASRADKVHAVQAHAAWALGTAVKNTGEFASFVVEPMPSLTVAHEATPPRSALLVLIDQISKVDVWDASRPHQDKVHKYLYALGSFVRGNPLAQRQFVTSQGPEALGRLLNAHVAAATAASRKVVHRIVSLVDDVVRETHDPSRPPTHVADALVRGLSTPDWCEATLVVLGQAAVRPGDVNVLSSSSLPAMRILRATAPHCHSEEKEWPAQARAATARLLQQWRDELAAASTRRTAQEAEDVAAGGNHGLEDLQEGIDLAQSVLAVLEGR